MIATDHGRHDCDFVLAAAVLMTFSTAYSDKMTLTACFLVERNATTLFYNFDRSAAAVQLALDYANEYVLPENVVLKTVIVDIGSTCSSKNHVLSYAMDLLTRGVTCNVYIGPGCGSSLETLYDLASSFGTPIIGCPAAGVGASAPRSEYPFLTRISITHTSTARRVIRFLKEQNYTTPVFIQDLSNSFFQQMSVVMSDFIKQSEFDLYVGTKFIDIRSQKLRNNEIKEILLTIFIMLAPSDAVRRFMLMAHDLGLTTGDYVFYGVNLFQSATWGNFSWSYNDFNDMRAKEAFRPLLLAALTVSREPAFEIFSKSVMQNSVKMQVFPYRNQDEVDIVTAHFYDSVIYYTSMVRDLKLAGRDFTNGNELVALFKNSYNFTSPVNGLVKINTDGDRQLNSYVLLNFNPASGEFEDYANYFADGTIKLLGELKWPGSGNQLPPNIPFCGFLGDDPRCFNKLSATQIALAIVFPLAIMILGTYSAVFVFRRFLSISFDPFWWRILEHELITPRRSSKFSTSGVISRTASGYQKSKLSLNGDVETITAESKMNNKDPFGATKQAIYNTNLVALQELKPPYQRANSAIGKCLLPIKRLQHQNIQRFYGITVNEENLCEYVVGDRCTKGTLTRLLLHDSIILDWTFKCALFKDLSNGMSYLHSTNLHSLGNLSSNTCLIDSNFVLKICDYGLSYFWSEEDLAPITEHVDNRDYELLFWRAPEFLRLQMPLNGSQKGDVYSYAIIIQQILLRCQPYGSNDGHNSTLPAKEILLEVKKHSMPPVRPRIPVSSCAPAFLELIEQCWDETSSNRPPFSKIRQAILRILGHSGDSIVDNLIKSMEKTSVQLEFQAEERTRQFMEEKRRSDDILSQILPKSIAEKLTKGIIVLPETFDSVTVHFSDVWGFAELTAEAETPVDTVTILNTLYSTCDEVIDKFDVYKVETVKDAYLIVSGLPIPNGIRHADEIASMDLMLKRAINMMKVPFASHTKLKLRIGIHSGSCVAAIIGTRMPRYCLFGDTVNTSSRMESHGEEGKIHCSHATKTLLDIIGGFVLVDRGEISIKGKGPMKTYWVIAKE